MGFVSGCRLDLWSAGSGLFLRRWRVAGGWGSCRRGRNRVLRWFVGWGCGELRGGG